MMKKLMIVCLLAAGSLKANQYDDDPIEKRPNTIVFAFGKDFIGYVQRFMR